MSDISLSKAVRSNLLSLQSTAEMMAKTQERLATGNKVNSALDNPTNFFTAASLNSRAGDLNSLMDSMSNGIKTLEAADNGLSSITKTLESMQSTLRQARQDKSFQNGTFEVTANSVLNLSGGRFDTVAEIKLHTAAPGVPAAVTSSAVYNGATVGATEGAGARTIVSLEASTAGPLKIDDKEITLAAGDDAADIISKLDTVLGGDGTGVEAAKKYTITQGSGGNGANANQVIIEAKDPYATSPKVEFGTGLAQAVNGSSTFTYSPTIVGAVTAGGQAIATGATFEEFVAGLNAKAKDGNYSVNADPTSKQITLTSTLPAGAAPPITGIPDATGGRSTTTFTSDASFNIGAETVDLGATSGRTTINTATSGNTFTVDGKNVNLGAVNGSTTFTLDASMLGTADINVGGTNVTINANTGDAAAWKAAAELSINGALNGAGSAVVDASTGAVTITATDETAIIVGAGTDNPPTTTYTPTDGQTSAIGDDIAIKARIDAALAANPPTAATSTVNAGVVTITTTATGAGTAPVTTTATGAGTSTAVGQAAVTGDDLAIKTRVDQALTALGQNTNITSAVDGGVVTLTANAAGATTLPVVTNAAGAPTVVTGSAASGVGYTRTDPVAGAHVKAVDAAIDDLKVTYGDKTIDLKLHAMRTAGSPATAAEISAYREAATIDLNNQLKAADMENLVAAFDGDGKLSITSKASEAKTLAISGDDAANVFGAKTVATGKAAVSGYNSSAPVDQFVEEINKNYAGQLRASNDNGKLRIENLSTQELDVSFDKDGPGAGTALESSIVGNSVRSNLANQFNELKDQLDRLSDDASFNGINLLRGDNLTITFNESGNSFINIRTADGNGLNATSLKIQNLSGVDLDSDIDIDKLLGDIKLALSSVRTQASQFGSNLSIVQNRQDFTKQMINTLETGAANLTLADMNEEAANLLALQTRQSLSSSSLSLASQADQSVLQLLQ